MKNIFLISLFCLFSFSLFAQSNIRLGYQGVNYEHANATFFGPTVSAETNMGNHFSLNLTLGFLADNNASVPDIKTRAFKFEPEVRFFLRQGLKGLFIGGRMSYSNFSSVLKSGKDKIPYPTWGGEESVIGVGGVLGFQANFSDQLMLSASLGLEVDNVDGEAMPSLGIGLGYKF